MDDLAHRRALNNGFGDGLSRAIELIVTPALFALAGYGLDRWWGTLPWCTIALGLFGVVGSLLSTWIRYDAEMRRHEEERMAARTRNRVPRAEGAARR